MATQRYFQAKYFASGYFPANYFAGQSPAPVQFKERYLAPGYFGYGYFATGYFGGTGVTTPVARNLSTGWGPGVQPNARAQFRATPRAIIIPPPPVTALAAISVSYSVSTADLSSLTSTGGLAFISGPGPGVGPFSNNQFQATPRGIIAGGPQFRMAGQAGSLVSVTASLSQLQAWAATSSTFASGTADLNTLRTSGGAGAFITQPGPGVGPFSNNQFQSSPRSTNKAFQALVAAGAATATTRGAAALNTKILLATDVPGALYLLAEDGSFILTEDGRRILVSSPMRGAATAMAALGTSTALIAAAGSTATGASAMTTAARFAASATSIAQGSASALTGITLAANVTGLSYVSAAIGSGTILTVTAAGLASGAAGLLTQTLIGATSFGFGSATAALGTASQMIAAASASVTASGSMSTSIQLSAQAVGLVQGTAALSGSVILTASASGFASGQAAVTSGPQFMAAAMATGYSLVALQTSVAPYSALGSASASASANLNGNVTLAASAASLSQVTARLLTVLQPPGEFADIRWLRAPRGGDVAYAEFFQRVGESLWYGVNWEDWLASNWEANSSAALAQAIRPTISNGFEFVCITPGQTGAVEPIWPTFAGGIGIDGTAMWQAQPVSSVSLDDTISNSSFSSPLGVVIDSGQVVSLRSYLIIETPAAVVGTDYDVLCTIFTTGGQQKIAKLRIKVR